MAVVIMFYALLLFVAAACLCFLYKAVGLVGIAVLGTGVLVYFLIKRTAK